MSNENQLTALEKRAAWTLAAIFAFRMIGLFMLLPVMAIYGQNLTGYSPFTVGLAIGSYGLVQSLVMIPLGKLSDSFGRKKLIVIGLLVFALGAVVAALSTHIYGVIAGRALQGAGGIAGVVLALAADLTAEHRRSKVMAIIGISIGFSFLLAFALGPVLAAQGGLPAVFWATALMALFGVVLTWQVVPAEPAHVARSGQSWALLWQLLQQGQLARLAGGIFVLHMMLIACFSVLPGKLLALGLSASKHGMVYLPIMLVGAVLMMPFLRMAERRSWHKPLLFVFIGLMITALSGLAMAETLLPLLIALGVFFWAFNWLEASLPAWVSRIVPATAKGTAMGFYTSAQFLGAFCGGAGAGILQTLAPSGLGASWVLAGAALIGMLWCLLSLGLAPLPLLKEVTLSAEGESFSELAARLQALEGVVSIVEIPGSDSISLTYDQRKLDPVQLTALSGDISSRVSN